MKLLLPNQNISNKIKKISNYVKAVLFILIIFYGKQSNAQGTWMPIASPAPDYNGGEMLLLTDGTVMVKTTSGGSDQVGSVWDKLTPDASGSYINGTWSVLSSMTDTRLYFSSQVLRNGNVYIAGGEYGSGRAAGEVYNPQTDTWTAVPALPGADTMSDANSEILPDGTVLQAVVLDGYNVTNKTYIYNPVTNIYTAGPLTLGSDNESAWVKLPDNSILYVDINSTNAERYIPSTNTWVADASVPVGLYDPYGEETGAGFLLPDGRAFFIGSTSTTAYYTPSGNTSPGTWTAGPALPNALGAPDAAAAMMVNGKILMALSPTPISSDHFQNPTSFYEFDYITNTFTLLNGPDGNAQENYATYVTNMLDLPDGTVLFSTQGDNQYYEYVPNGAPLAAGKPTISAVSASSCTSYALTGTLFNGISEGAAYGDDWQMATNYPIVQLTSGSNVYYARTYSWNSTAVQTGSLADTTQFDVPSGLPDGTYSLRVIANGIASDPISFTYPQTTNSVTSTAPNSRCGGGSLVLGATASGGTLNWYASSTGGSIVGTGVSFNTPIIGTTTTYYVAVTDNCGNSVRTPVIATIQTINVGTTTNGPTITAIQNGASYQWINCAGSTPIPGEVNQSYTPTVNGNYAVLITKNGCSSTSACVNVSTLGINNYSTESILSIYPNPTNGIFTISLKTTDADKYVMEIDDMVGKKILYKTLKKQTSNEIDLSGYPKGIYLIKINDGTKNYTSKIAVQ